MPTVIASLLSPMPLSLLGALIVVVTLSLWRAWRGHHQQLNAQWQLQQLTEQLSDAQQQNQQQQQTISDLQQQLSQRTSQAERLLTELKLSQKYQQQQQQWQQQQSQQLKNEFSVLAQQILNDNSQQFKQQQSEQLQHLLNPFNQQLQHLKQSLEQAKAHEIAGRAQLSAQLSQLQQLNQQITAEAHNLTQALKGDKKLQGIWGELQVETLLERSGLLKDQEYRRELAFNEQGSQKRPDFVVFLPDDKHLIIDSKVSLNDYLRYAQAEDELSQQQALSAHIQCIRQHIKTLSHKAYDQLDKLNSPDFVLMFMPIEPAFMVAFQHDPQLFNDAFDARIVVVTPTTLLATLRTVANIWTIERQNRHAKALADRAAKVYDKLRVFLEKMDKLDNQLDLARKTFDEAVTNLKSGQGNLLSQSQKFLELGVRVKKQVPKHWLEHTEPELERPSASGEIELVKQSDNEPEPRQATAANQ